MKLQLVAPGTGLSWVKLGVKTFFRQPLAMSGLFFMFMAVVSVLSVVPVIGSALSLALVPAATLGLMAATREALQGRFPMPLMLLTAFRQGSERRRSMLVLGALYAGALLLVLGVATLTAGAAPGPAELGELGEATQGEMTPEQVRSTLLNPGMWWAMLVYMPVLMAFWHAPALVHWHGVSPVKSLFFSLLACWRNKGAMLVYSAGWVGVFMLIGLVLSLLSALLGGAAAMNLVLYPAVLFMASMFHTSIYFTFRDSFVTDEPDEQPEPSPPTV
jgi:hypothetical protein